MKLIILDRDGVINEDSDDYIKSASEWQIIPGSDDAIGKLCRHGFLVAVATNQSGLSRGLFSETTLKEMHDKMTLLLAQKGGQLAQIQYCPHHPNDDCRCRKPSPYMLKKIMEDLHCGPEETIMIGDSEKDIKAAHNAGCLPMLVRTGKGQSAARSKVSHSINTFKNLSEAVNYIICTYGKNASP